MQLKNLEPLRVPVTLCGQELYLRYDLNARRALEDYAEDIETLWQKDSDDWTVTEVVWLLRAGLMDNFYKENEEYINKGQFDKCKPSVAMVGHMVDTAGLSAIVCAILEAAIGSLPPAPVGMTAENFPPAPQGA